MPPLCSDAVKGLTRDFPRGKPKAAKPRGALSLWDSFFTLLLRFSTVTFRLQVLKTKDLN